jgi:hypothetical protein
MAQPLPATARILPQPASAQQSTTPRFDLIFALLSVWFVIGLLVDTWAHSYALLNAQETFFTPWHGLFYTGYFAVAALLIGSIWRRSPPVPWRSVAAWRAAVPRGYELSLLGVAMFLIGGGLDPFWHLIAGREAGLDTLMSPTHIFFAVAMVLIVSGPIRAAWHREDSTVQSFRALLPVLISVFLVQWMFTFQTLYNHPIQVFPSLSQYGGTALLLFGEMVGTSGFPIHTAIFVGLVLILLRRWRLPPGSFTFLIGAHYLMLAPQNMLYPMILPLVVVMILAGAAIDLLYARLQPTHAERRAQQERHRLYLFAFLMPVILHSAYFAVLFVLDTTIWSAHLVLGNIAVTGLTGLTLAALVSTIASPIPTD